MNDAGSDDSRKHTMENHIRNSLTVLGGTYNNNVPNRPLWHGLLAGSNGVQPTSFDQAGKAMYGGYSDLISPYSHTFGAGMVEFIPSNGMNPMKARDPDKWSEEHFYVTWHPGPLGHRLYAEMIAYFYLGAALKALDLVQPVIGDLEKALNFTFAAPVVEILDILQDPPYFSGLPDMGDHRKCDPICTDATHQFCILGFNPKDHAYDLRKYVVDANGWKYENVASNPQPITAMDGGQASIDTKFGFKGNKNSGQLVVSVTVIGHRIVMVEKPYADWGGLNDVLKKMDKWFRATIVDVVDIDIVDAEEQKNREQIMEQQKGKILKCEVKDKKLWTRDLMNFGCQLRFEYAGKYHVGFTVDTDEDIPICVLASY